MERIDVAVVGAGQAGLATSHELTDRGVDHLVLERGRIGQSWRGRWDSFCLVTPNWSIQLPGGEYDGDDPDGYLPRDAIVAHLEHYATSSKAPVREDCDVRSIRKERDDFVLETTASDLRAGRVVLSTGAYQRAHRPEADGGLPGDIARFDSSDYRNPEALPPGRVLVIGSGQSGCQIAEELHDAGREVFLSCGRAPWVPRRLGGRDIVWWTNATGFLDQSVSDLVSPEARLESNILATGRGGGHDLHLRTLQQQGVTLLGRFSGCDGLTATFVQDLGATIAWGDERFRKFMDLVRTCVRERGLDDPDIPEPRPFDDRSPERLDLVGFGAVIFAGGYRPDYRSWLPWPEAFDDHGFPIHRDGESTIVPDLYFVGVHFLRVRKSSLLIGVGEDAALVARAIAA